MPIEEYGKSSMRKFLIRAVYASGTFLLGLLLSGAKAPLDTYPFIIALTSSLTSCAGFASLGVLCRLTVDGSIGTSAFTYCAAAILVCAARWVFCFLFIHIGSVHAQKRAKISFYRQIPSARFGQAYRRRTYKSPYGLYRLNRRCACNGFRLRI